MANRVAVITMGVKLGHETKGYTRFLSVCQALRAAGFDVDLYTSSFQHWYKQQRDKVAFPYDMYDFGVKFIDEPGYKKNIDPSRIRSHSIAAKNLMKMLEAGPEYDLIYSEIPPNDVALSAARFAESRGIPFVADINDLWPEAMRMVIDIPVISDILFSKLAKDAREVYRRLSAVVGTSDEYAMRPYTDCNQSIEHITVYVGNDLNAFDEGARAHSPEVKKPQGEFWVTYTGTLGKSYDIKTMIDASEELVNRGYPNIKMMILGDGPDGPALRDYAASTKANVEFTGYMDYSVMAAYLAKSDITVNSLVRKAPQSIVTKIGDYLAAGCPMINTGESREFCNKVESDGFGVNVMAEDRTILANAILDLYQDPERCAQMGKNARLIAEQQFDRKNSYKKICDLVGRLIASKDKPKP